MPATAIQLSTFEFEFLKELVKDPVASLPYIINNNKYRQFIANHILKNYKEGIDLKEI